MDTRIVIGVVTSLVLTIGILIIVIIVLSMVIIKGKKPHHRCTCKGLFSAKFVVCIGSFNMTLYIPVILQPLMIEILKRNQMRFMD